MTAGLALTIALALLSILALEEPCAGIPRIQPDQSTRTHLRNLEATRCRSVPLGGYCKAVHPHQDRLDGRSRRVLSRRVVQLTAYVRASNLAFMIVLTPAMWLVIVRQRGLFLSIFCAFNCAVNVRPKGEARCL